LVKRTALDPIQTKLLSGLKCCFAVSSSHAYVIWQLYAEAIADLICQGSETWQREAWQRAHVNASACGPQLAKMIVNAYLSQDHFDNQDGSCLMIGLPSKAARAAKTVKVAYRQVLKKMTRAFRSQSPARKAVRAAAGSGVGGSVCRQHGTGTCNR